MKRNVEKVKSNIPNKVSVPHNCLHLVNEGDGCIQYQVMVVVALIVHLNLFSKIPGLVAPEQQLHMNITFLVSIEGLETSLKCIAKFDFQYFQVYLKI